MNRLSHDVDHKWHVAINQENTSSADWKGWMYDAKQIADEVPRMAMLFKRERMGQLGTVHRQCSHSPKEEIVDNHLTCCMGVACRACPALLALEKAELAPEQIDECKAWTCAAHILNEQGPNRHIDTSEGMILTTDDRMYWDHVYDSLAATDRGE